MNLFLKGLVLSVYTSLVSVSSIVVSSILYTYLVPKFMLWVGIVLYTSIISMIMIYPLNNIIEYINISRKIKDQE